MSPLEDGQEVALLEKLENSDSRIFKNRRKLLPNYVPQKIVSRQKEFRELVRFFKPLLENGTSQKILISGEAGTGKTALGRRFGKELESVSPKKDMDLISAYVDCREHQGNAEIAWKICKTTNTKAPQRGVSAAEYLENLKKNLEKIGYRILIILDWIDFHVKQNGSDLIYSLTRLWENSNRKNKISLLGISRNPRLSKLLDPPTRSTFLHNRIELDRYTKPEIEKIIRKRGRLAFKKYVLDEKALDLIAKYSKLQDGVGLAIEWLRQAGKVAEEKKADIVKPEHVFEGKNRIHTQTSADIMRILNKHELLILLAYVKKAKNQSKDQILTGGLREEYVKICKAHCEKPKGYTRFSNLIKKLSDLRLIETIPTGGGTEGNSQKISLAEAPLSGLDAVIERFLNKDR